MKKVTYTQEQLENLLAIKDKEIELLKKFNDDLLAIVKNRSPYNYYPFYSTTAYNTPIGLTPIGTYETICSTTIVGSNQSEGSLISNVSTLN